MKQFNSIEELQPYLNEKKNTYEFVENGEENFDPTTDKNILWIGVNFDLTTDKNILWRDNYI